MLNSYTSITTFKQWVELKDFRPATKSHQVALRHRVQQVRDVADSKFKVETRKKVTTRIARIFSA